MRQLSARRRKAVSLASSSAAIGASTAATMARHPAVGFVCLGLQVAMLVGAVAMADAGAQAQLRVTSVINDC